MPLEIEPLLSDPDVQVWFDDQRWWYIRLILESWKYSANPAHLPNDPERLMTFAGIPSHEPRRVRAWRERSPAVLRKFETSEDGRWLFHPKTLETYVNQLAKWDAKRDAGSKGGKARVSISKQCLSDAQVNSSRQYVYSSSSSGSLDSKKEEPMNSEDLVSRVMGIGFRDSTWRSKSQIERALFEEIQGGADGSGMLASLCRIYRWTGNGVYAPKCFEVIPRWREPQELWERTNGTEKPKLGRKAQEQLEAHRQFCEAEARKNQRMGERDGDGDGNDDPGDGS